MACCCFYLQVVDVIDKTNELQIQYLKKLSDCVYTWPEEPELSTEAASSIVATLPSPALLNARGHVKFNDICSYIKCANFKLC